MDDTNHGLPRYANQRQPKRNPLHCGLQPRRRGPGFNYWNTTDTSQPVQIAQSFVVQPEAAALAIPTDHTNAAAVATFIQAIYGNLFSHAADAAGLAYWQGQITSGAVSLGAATYIIANGATGADATVLGLKMQGAEFFTTQTFARNLGTTPPLDSEFAVYSRAAVAPVVASGTLQTSEQDTIACGVPSSIQLVGQSDTTHAMHHG
jgi:hypothetical protein